ncbi:MAG: cupin domain-containing protein [Sandaracinaceae bacterium]|nr:cupin domain-containing protein [Sandaracinaceae bacterium]
MSYQVNVLAAAESNTDFRRVLFTGSLSQLVVMTLPPGGEIGEETHPHVEQTLICLSGRGAAIVNGLQTAFAAGDAVVVTPGATHNFINNGNEPLKIYTIYAPANHIDGRVHHTKADADADHEDEAFVAAPFVAR